MAVARGKKCTKESKIEPTGRTWLARPVLAPELTEDPPLEDAYVGFVREKRKISTAIQSISRILPGPNHLKRCSSNRLLLATVSSPIFAGKERQEEETLGNILRETLEGKGFDLSLLEDRFELVKVASRAPRTKAQATRVAEHWPVNFHPDPGLEKTIDGSVFVDREILAIERYMRVAIDAAREEAIGNPDCNGSSVIVDPIDGRILAVAAARIDLHPMWHASMLAVDLVAESQGGGAWKLRGNLGLYDGNENERNSKRKHGEDSPLFYPSSLSGRVSMPEEEALIEDNRTSLALKGGKNVDGTEGYGKNEPYLCTGYWAFLLKEPCALCAMALLHSRVSRIFYGVNNLDRGVLGSRAILHSVAGLNHRYRVWAGVLEEDCQEVSRYIEKRIHS